MFTNDFSKMFDPSQYAQNMQKMFDMNAAMSASKQSMEVAKQIGTIMADTISSCTEKQLQYAQTTMEDCIEAMRELSTAKGMEEYVQKQAQYGQKSAEKVQAIAQEMASQWQKSQTKCTDLVSKQVSQTMEWGKSVASGK